MLFFVLIFILDKIKQSADNELDKSYITGKSIVEYDSKYEYLIDYLFKNVVIVEDNHQNFNDDLIYLTKDGKSIIQATQIQGGSLGLFDGNKLGRKKKLDLLNTQILEIEKNEKVLDAEVKNHEAQLLIVKQNTFQHEIVKVDDHIRKLQIENATFKTKIESSLFAQNQFFAKETEYNQLINELNTKLSEIEVNHTTAQSKLNLIRTDLDKSSSENKLLSDELVTFNTAYNEKNVRFIQQQNKVNMYLKDCGNKEKQLEELLLSRLNDEKLIQTLSEELKLIDRNLEEISNNIIGFIQERKLKEQNLGSVEENYYKERSRINELEVQVKQLNRVRADLQSLVNNLKDKFNAIKYDLTSISERLKIEFGISINDIINQTATSNQSKESLLETSLKLKNRIDNFGEINTLAVQAYDEMKSRYDIISVQKNDIETARVSLENTIKEIEFSASTKFLESFTMIRENFTKVFRSLFSQDDNCDLVLDDPSNPLESNIQIIAKPKGKRPQSINQLSGGEKTLTATALLFALYLLKPAPFCIFDEVDAPLDDANIEKFNNIIKEFSKDSQFVIVTHNKATMAAVDIIYGVYMPELGISSVTPVDFRMLENQQVSSTIY